MSKYLTVCSLVSAALVLFGCNEAEKPSDEGPEIARFEFVHQHYDEIMFAETSNMEVISMARNELNKPLEQRTLHISGLLARGSRGINKPWSWHFVSDQWTLAELSMEVCDAWPSYIEKNIEQWLSDVGSFCPWASRVTKEIDL